MRRTTIGTVVALIAVAVATNPSSSDGATRRPPHRAPVAASSPSGVNPSVPVSLPLSGFRDLFVDEAHNVIYYAQGPGPLLLTDLDGADPHALPGMSGAVDLTLADDGSALWVALGDQRKIGRINLADQSTTTYSAGEDSFLFSACPNRVFTSSGLVWFGYSCDGGWQGIRALDPATGTLYQPTNTAWVYWGRWFTSPEVPDLVFADELGESQSVLRTVGLPNPDYTIEHRFTYRFYSDNWAFDPINGLVVASDGTGLDPDTYADESTWRHYPARGADVAVRADGMLAFTSARTTILEAGGETVLRTLPLAGDVLGAQFGTERLYMLEETDYDGFFLVTFIPRPAPTLRVSLDDTKYDYGDKIHLTGRLGPGPSDRTLTVWRNPFRKARVQVGTTVADASGNFAFDAKAVEWATYDVVSTEADGYDAVMATSKEVSVTARTRMAAERSVGHQGRYHLWPVKKAAVMRATVLPNKAHQCVGLWAQFHYRGHWGYDEYVTCARLDETSRAWAVMKGSPKMLKIPFRVRCTFRGDNRNRYSQSPWLYGRFVKKSKAEPGLTGARLVGRNGSSVVTLAPRW